MQVRPIPDGEWSTVATDIGFGEASRYVRLDPGTHDVQLLAAGSGRPRPRGRRRRRRRRLHPDRERHRPGRPGRGSGRPADARPAGRTRRRPDGRAGRPDPGRGHRRGPQRRRSRTATSTARSATPRSRSPCRCNWNGKLLTTSRGFSGTEFSNDGIYKNVALRRGYVYAASDEGWFRLTIANEPEDSYYESRRRIAELTQHAAGVAAAHYGRALGAQRVRGPLQRRPPHQVADRVLPRALRRRREHVRLQLGPGDVAGVPDLPAQLRRHRAAHRRHHRRPRRQRDPAADAQAGEGARGHLQRPRQAAQRLQVRRRPRAGLRARVAGGLRGPCRLSHRLDRGVGSHLRPQSRRPGLARRAQGLEPLPRSRQGAGRDAPARPHRRPAPADHRRPGQRGPDRVAQGGPRLPGTGRADRRR